MKGSMKGSFIIRCMNGRCNKDITYKVKVFDTIEKKIWCQECNIKIGKKQKTPS